MNIYENIINITESITSDLISIRRDFHKNAEPGWLEVRTSSIIARKLTEMGYEVLYGEDVCNRETRMGVPDADVLAANYKRAVEAGADMEFAPAMADGMTGVIGILRCGEGPTVALRFDIDALGVIESQDADHRPTAEGFCSVNNGAMHACGHDGHASIGLGVAHVLMQLRDKLRGTVKLIFQPSEEGVRGAKSIVDKGHLDGVQYFIGSHITSAAACETADVTPGSFGSLATTKYDVEFHGLSAHAGGSPHAGKNVMLALSTAILNLYAIPRHGKGMTRINVGTVHAGSGRNVIADHAKLEIEVRGETTDLNKYMTDKATAILRNAAAMHDCTCDIKLMGAADSQESTIELCERIAKVTTEGLGMKVTDTLTKRNTGSEDVSYMMNRVQEQGGQATFMRVLTKCMDVAHNRRYDFDESVIPRAVKVFSASVYDIMK